MGATACLWCTKACIEYKSLSTLANSVGLPKKEGEISNTVGNSFPIFCVYRIFVMEKCK